MIVWRSIEYVAIYLVLVASIDAAPWGSTGKKESYGSAKKSDAKLEDDIMDGKKEKYDDPSDPPDWLLSKKLLDPGLPTTPPPPPTMMIPPPAFDDQGMNGMMIKTQNSFLRGQGNGMYSPPSFSFR